MNRLVLVVALMAALLAPGHARAQCSIDGDAPCHLSLSGLIECCRPIDYVNSLDPNDLFGPAGIGVLRSVGTQAHLPYTIYFENVATATAPAQEVRVTDTLDPTLFDLSTFAFLNVAFDDTVVVAPPGASSFSRDVDRRPAHDEIVRIEGSINLQTGVITCRLRSLDPLTLDPLDNPDGGFLPPNQTPPEGDGSVAYVVRPKPGLPTATRIPNIASVVFDVNPPLATPEWFNTIDANAPTSQVDPLPPVSGHEFFEVSWGGSDLGSGVRDYTVYVSDDNGPYQPWRISTAAESDTFPGTNSHTYRFYAVARDSVGNLEAVPGVPDATTLVDISTAAMPALVDARSDANHVRLLWYYAGSANGARVERRTAAADWEVVGVPQANGGGYLEFRDSTVTTGTRYGYRLGLPSGESFDYFGEVWVETSESFELTMGLQNPATPPVLLNYTLPGPGAARLEVFDVAGRRMFARDLEGLGPGAHRYALSDAARLAAGTYVIRLSHGGRALTRKVMVLR